MQSSTKTIPGGESIDSKLTSCKQPHIHFTVQDTFQILDLKNYVQMFHVLQRVCKFVASRIRHSSLSGSYIQVFLFRFLVDKIF